MARGRATLSDAAMTSTAWPLTYACGRLAPRYSASPADRRAQAEAEKRRSPRHSVSPLSARQLAIGRLGEGRRRWSNKFKNMCWLGPLCRKRTRLQLHQVQEEAAEHALRTRANVTLGGARAARVYVCGGHGGARRRRPRGRLSGVRCRPGTGEPGRAPRRRCQPRSGRPSRAPFQLRAAVREVFSFTRAGGFLLHGVRRLEALEGALSATANCGGAQICQATAVRGLRAHRPTGAFAWPPQRRRRARRRSPSAC